MAKVAVVGGTGHLGKALARRLARAGHQVFIGSRSTESAAQASTEIGGAGGGTNATVTHGADFVFVTVPYAAQTQTLTEIRDQVGEAIVVDTTVPLVPPKVMRVQLPSAGCAALEAQAILAPGTRVVSALHNVAAHVLATDEPVDCDVLVFSDDADARKAVIALLADAGLRGFSGGSLANSAAAEALTSVLIHINKLYSSPGAGIRLTNV